MPDRLSTGVEILDRRLDGGVPPGSIVALVASPESQSELLLDSMATAGPSCYLTSVRPPEVIRETLAENYYTVENVEVVEVGVTDFADKEATDRLLDNLPENGYLVVDSTEPLEALGREKQRGALAAIRGVVREREAVCIVHCLGSDLEERPRRTTIHHADQVWSLELSPTKLKIENRLYITKVRGGAALVEPVKLELTDGVHVDTSRDI